MSTDFLRQKCEGGAPGCWNQHKEGKYQERSAGTLVVVGHEQPGGGEILACVNGESHRLDGKSRLLNCDFSFALNGFQWVTLHESLESYIRLSYI